MLAVNKNEYKYNFILLKGSKSDSALLTEAINKYIKELTEQLPRYTEKSSYINDTRLRETTEKIITLMNFRDNMEYLVSDEVSKADDFPHPILRLI